MFTQTPRYVLHLCLILGLFALLTAVFWVGVTASDDTIYIFEAEKWARGAPELPTSHWGFRYPLVLALGGAIAALGSSEFTAGVVSFSYAAFLLFVVYAVVRRFTSARLALAAGCLLATFPLLVVKASVLNADVPEALFAVISLGLFVEATQQKLAARYLFLSGIAGGLAFLTRETGAGLMLLYLGFFLFGAYFDRKLYLWGAAGFLCVFGLETAWYVLAGEGPLYRFLTIAGSHGTMELTLEDYREGTGNVSSNRIVGPILALLVNQEFALLYYFAAAAIWYLLRWADLRGGERVFVQVLSAAFVLWVLWISYNGAIRPLPRYYAVSSVIGTVLVAMWLWHMRVRARKYALGLVAVFVLGNLAGLSVENTHPRYASRALAAYLQETDETVFADRQTFSRTGSFLRWSAPEVRARLQKGLPQEGGLFLYNPNAFDPTGRRRVETEAFVTGKGWQPVRRWEPPKRLIGLLVTGLHMEGLVPETVRNRLIYCGRPITLYRIDGRPG